MLRCIGRDGYPRYRSGGVNVVRPSCFVVLATAVALTASVSSTAEGSARERFDRNGITFGYPSSWFVTTKPLSNGVNPTYRFTVSTTPVHRTPKDLGPCLAGIAKQLPRTAVVAYLREAVGADRRASLPNMQPRPRTFPLPSRADNGLPCFGRGGRWVPFKTGGRAFYLGLYIGPRASPASIRALGKLVDEMKIKPR